MTSNNDEGRTNPDQPSLARFTVSPHPLSGDDMQPLSVRVAMAMGEIATIEKTGTNSFMKYNYATADDVFSALRPILSKYFLEIRMSELKCKFTPTAKDSGLRAIISYEIGFVGGAMETRTIIISITSPQSMQAAATYAIKYWLRTKLLLSTGELDSDEENHPPVPLMTTSSKSKKPKGSCWEITDDGILVAVSRPKSVTKEGWENASQRELYIKILRLIQENPTQAFQVWENNQPLIKTSLPKSGFDALVAAKDKCAEKK